MLSRLLVFLLLLLGVSSHADAQNKSALKFPNRSVASPPKPTADYAQGRLIVKFKDAQGAALTLQRSGLTPQEQCASMLKRYGAGEMEPLWKPEHQRALERAISEKGMLNGKRVSAASLDAARLSADVSRIYVVNYQDDIDALELARRVSQLDGVEYAEPDYTMRITLVPNDPLINTSGQDYFEYQNFFRAWDVSIGDTSITIAIVDMGIDYNHPDILGKLWTNQREIPDNNIDDDGNGFIDDVRGWDFQRDPSFPQDNNPINDGAGDGGSHGTWVGGVAGANTNNGTGIAGTGFNCRLMAVKVGSGDQLTFSNLSANRGILYAASNGADVINCSFGSTVASQSGLDAVNFATARGALVVAAAGNDGNSIPNYPASFSNALSVGSVNHIVSADRRSSFSNFGETVEVYATGSGILSTGPGGRYDNVSGTSFSAPVVSGLAGLIKARNRTWTPQQISNQIIATSDFLTPLNGRRINAFNALTRRIPALILDSVTITSSNQLFLRIRNYNDTLASAPTFTVASRSADVIVSNPTISRGSVAPGETVDLLFSLQLPSTDLTTVRASFIITAASAAQNYSVSYPVDFSRNAWRGQASFLDVSAFFNNLDIVNRSVAWGVGDAGTVIRTTNGQSWSIIRGPQTSGNLYAVAALDANTAVAGDAVDGGSGNLYRTTDGASTWSTVYRGANGAFWNAVHFFDARNGIAQSDPTATSGGRFLIVKTSDGGATWTPISTAPSARSGEFGLVASFYFADANNGWFGTNQGRVFRTSDGGNTWTPTAPAPQDVWLPGIAFSSATTGVAAGYVTVTRNGQNSIAAPALYRTTDGGSSWSAVSVPGAVAFFGAGAAPNANQLWVSGVGAVGRDTLGLIYTSKDGGRTWRVQNSEILSDENIKLSFATDSETTLGYALTGFGQVLSYAEPRNTSSAPILDRTRPIPTDYALAQNYPNPFNPTTTISYQLPTSGNVSLKVYDMLGREVATLANTRQDAGTYTVQFSAANYQLSSGVYFYRLQAGTFVETKKMLLIK